MSCATRLAAKEATAGETRGSGRGGTIKAVAITMMIEVAEGEIIGMINMAAPIIVAATLSTMTDAATGMLVGMAAAMKRGTATELIAAGVTARQRYREMIITKETGLAQTSAAKIVRSSVVARVFPTAMVGMKAGSEAATCLCPAILVKCRAEQVTMTHMMAAQRRVNA